MVKRHCVDAEGNTVESDCSRPEYEYNVPLRVGLLFVILTTSAIAVFFPILTARFSRIKNDGIIFVILRQFGTGVIISTALVHVSREDKEDLDITDNNVALHTCSNLLQQRVLGTSRI